jgi:ribosomal protein S27E
MNHKYAVVLGAFALIMAATAWATYPSSKPKPVADPSKLGYLHCPQCLRERMYTPTDADIPCPYCDRRLVATEESIKKTGNPGNPHSFMFVLLFAESVVAMAAVLVVGHKRHKSEEEDYLYINCEKCRQKIRYRVQQVGLAAMCRRCGQTFVYPEEGPDEE